MRKLVLYETVDGKCPWHEWFNELKDRKAQAALDARLLRLQRGQFGDCKRVGAGVSELRVHYGPGYRIYLPEFMMVRRGRSYEEALLERLRDHEYAVDYLNAVLAADGPDATGTFLAALRLVAKAQSLPMADLARDAELGRQALYRSLSQEGNPELDTLTRVLRELGLRLAVESAA
jgi:putative addiction module killer protein/probable addiction module antidote protein